MQKTKVTVVFNSQVDSTQDEMLEFLHFQLGIDNKGLDSRNPLFDKDLSDLQPKIAELDHTN